MGTGEFAYKLNWESNNVKYKHFTDLGHYLIMTEDMDCNDYDEIAPALYAASDVFQKPCCTATVKKNAKGEVIVGRNMDVTISNNPAFITRFVGGKFTAVTFSYGGKGSRYSYDQLEELDNDNPYLRTMPYKATDAFNEAGLYIETNMREEDSEYSEIYCSGTNPGRKRACVLSAPALIAANCGTVEEVVDFLNDSYDWYTGGLELEGEGSAKSMWNLALIIGDAKGNYGLIEFVANKILFTPYANGQGNYYIHPAAAEYARYGTGYGRFAAALKGLPACETEWDMLHNMESCMWQKEIMNPGCLGYSDIEIDIVKRRERTVEDMQKAFDDKMIPLQPLAEEYYKGNEKPLRQDGMVWTTSFNFGVNCKTKHLILRLWEKDDSIIELQW